MAIGITDDTMTLGIGDRVVATARFSKHAAGALDRGRGDVDPERAPRPGRARGLAGRLPGPAADVEDVVAELDAAGPAQDLVMLAQLGVVTVGAWALLVTGVHHGWHPALSPQLAG